jgi:photosystem II stability/assembly factor-like uncharacterized protein
MPQLVRTSFPALAAAVLLSAPALEGQDITADQFQSLQARHIGPVGNRVTSVTGVAGDRFTYYAGAASGGVWKTVDGGINWAPVFDDYPVHAIGAITVAPSDPNVVWIGTGEPFIRSNVSIGNGVWRSTDAGDTWQHMGLDESGRISRVIVHPTDPDVVYVAALGHAYAPQEERGIYRTADGGETWERVLFVDQETGASDLVMDPSNPRILFAGMWSVKIRTWTRESGGPGGGLFKSRDGGDTWVRLEGNGLPEGEVGKVAVCMSPTDPDRVYALIETGDGVPWHGSHTDSGELWRSDNGGESWEMVNQNRDLAGRTAYYSRCAVSTNDPDEVYFLAAAYSTTKDGGLTHTVAGFNQAPNWDHHDMWIDPANPDRQVVSGDGGVGISENRGRTWFRAQLPVAQMYHVTVDNAVPYNVMGNRQDGPSVRGPSNSRLAGGFVSAGIPRGMWHTVGGGESGFATPDPTDPGVVWSSASGAGGGGGIVVRWEEDSRQFRMVEVWPESTIGQPAENLRYRFQWTFPLLISPHDNNTIYVTSQHVHGTTNGGQSWEVISPDLTTNDRSKMGISGGLTPDNIGVEYCCVIYAFDESPVQQGVFYAGSNDGLVHVSRDNGETWQNVTDNLPDLPPDGVVRRIDASRWDAGKAYLTVEHHQVGNFDPHVYRTEDYGESWTKIVDGIGEGPLNYVRSIEEDPVRPGLLYLGTESTMYISFDDGDSWRSLHTNLPHTPMYWTQIQPHFNDLVIGTYGRGFWIMDDITPFQQLTDEVTSSDAYLFEPRDAYRFQGVSEVFTMFDDQSAGDNPPYGASLNYWLGEEVEGDVEIRISDAEGELVRTLEGTKSQGINRVWWDLRGELSTEIKLRTRPLHADWVELGPERWRSYPGGGRVSLLMPPGTYTVTLAVGEGEQARSLEVLKDPHSKGTLADILAQHEVLEDIRADIEATAAAVNQLEWIRRQVLDAQAVLADQEDGAELAERAGEVSEALVAVEENLLQMRATGSGQDNIRWPTRLLERLTYLAGNVAVADFRPNDQQGEVHAILKDRLVRIQHDMQEVLEGALADFNRRLQARGLRIISEEE